MSDLEAALRAIWESYASQRNAETAAHETATKALRDLLALNKERALLGLSPVGEFRDPQGVNLQAQAFYIPPPKTWRDEMDSRLLAVVKQWLA